MEKKFGPMMEGFFSSMSEKDKQKLMACMEKMAEMCPYCNIKGVSEEDKKALMERMKTCCGSKME